MTAERAPKEFPITRAADRHWLFTVGHAAAGDVVEVVLIRSGEHHEYGPKCWCRPRLVSRSSRGYTLHHRPTVRGHG